MGLKSLRVATRRDAYREVKTCGMTVNTAIIRKGVFEIASINSVPTVACLVLVEWLRGF